MDHHIVNLDSSPWSDKGHYYIWCDNRIDYFKHVGFGVLGFWGFGVLGFWGFGVLGFWEQ
jgi:hypothetical protein